MQQGLCTPRSRDFACRNHDSRLASIFGGEGRLTPAATLHGMIARRKVLPVHELPAVDSLCIDYSEFQQGHTTLALAGHLHDAGIYAQEKLAQVYGSVGP